MEVLGADSRALVKHTVEGLGVWVEAQAGSPYGIEVRNVSRQHLGFHVYVDGECGHS